MRKIAIAIIACLICGCPSPDDIKPTQYKKLGGGSITVIEFDNHEYLIMRVTRGCSICHKANCKFCEEE